MPEDTIIKKDEAKPQVEPSKDGETLTQEQVNKILAKERRKYETNQAELRTQLEQVQRLSSGTKEEREQLESELETMRGKLLTAEERAQEDLRKKETEAATQIQFQTERGDRWEGLYKTSQVNAALASAALSGDNPAHNPDHITMLLAGQTSVVESDGKFQIQVNMPGKDKDGNTANLVMTPDEAVNKLREDARHATLFKGKGVPGIGSQAPGMEGGVEPGKMSYQQYKEYRSKGGTL